MVENDRHPGAVQDARVRLTGRGVAPTCQTAEPAQPALMTSARIPSLSSWLVDVGLGLDWSGFGAYIAKAVTTGERLRFTVRLDHRF